MADLLAADLEIVQSASVDSTHASSSLCAMPQLHHELTMCKWLFAHKLDLNSGTVVVRGSDGALY